MPWSGGIYDRLDGPTGWQDDAAASIPIQADLHDNSDNDVRDGINQCLNKDGSNSATGNLNLANNKITNLATGTLTTDASTVAQVQNSGLIWGGTSTGSANAQIISPTPAVLAYAAGQVFRFIAGFTPTSTLTLQVSSLSAQSIIADQVGTSSGNLAIMKGMVCEVVYNGTNFILRNAAGSNVFLGDYNNGNTSRSLSFFKSRGAEFPTNTIVQNGDAIGLVAFNAANGTGYDRAAYIAAEVGGVPGASGDMPGRLLFGTTPDGSATTLERMRIISTGQVIIGATSTTFSSEILAAGTGSGQQAITVNGGTSGTGGGGAFYARNGATTIAAVGGYSAIIGGAYDATPLFYASSTPKVVGITSAVGDRFMKWSTTTNSWTYDTSSARFKDNIADCPYGLTDVLAMQPRSFEYKFEENRADVGFIAEELLSVIPEVVGLDKDGLPEAVMYDRLTSVLCKAIQELHAKVAALEARIEQLEA